MSGFGAGWQGAGWSGAGWLGAGWQGAGWGGGGVPIFALRTDKPLADFSVASDLTATYPDYPGRAWDADLWALSVLPEFFGTGLPGGDWKGRITLAPPAAVTQADIDRLLILAVTERPEAMGEIIQQHQNFQLYWLQLLMIDAGTHPSTFLLMKLVARVGETVMMHFKRLYNRPRPSQVCPTLFPPVPVPGHGSYPAGHALIPHLTSLALMELVPSVKHSALLELARIVGYNRVIAGLHYESDIAAGVSLAQQVLPVLKECPTYDKVKTRAAAEW